VKQYLISKGIDENRLMAIGFGESLPRVPNVDANSRAQNRRTEFEIVD
jgi:OOP family OmpA-OmpF porin